MLAAAVVLVGGVSFTGADVDASVKSKPHGDSRLDEIQRRGYIRACTPGDYRPFALRQADGSYKGLDITMVNDLAKALEVQVRYVPSPWSALVPTFTSQKCDIAIGGISVTLTRQKDVFFSKTVLVNGKVPLTRCENVSRFQKIADMNKPSVKVITPPGGTNEAFARANLPLADLIVWPNNITIFDEIVAGRADVMVTEATEAVVQSKVHPELCAVNPDKPLQYGELGYMLPKGDIVWKEFVDQWLHLLIASGQFQKFYDADVR
ncbi:transporter substrate-binding domain-containing protein [Actinomadura alba]|uniref:Transporter substrate-binding domain-containing protein n=2 Tax=Actinomadura alba TaxID=406431 RepID=A0ABR7LYT0_9ACTN|nr:transporter substrate-binding domain-containing protein [Actinomadura alba]